MDAGSRNVYFCLDLKFKIFSVLWKKCTFIRKIIDYEHLTKKGCNTSTQDICGEYERVKEKKNRKENTMGYTPLHLSKSSKNPKE